MIGFRWPVTQTTVVRDHVDNHCAKTSARLFSIPPILYSFGFLHSYILTSIILFHYIKENCLKKKINGRNILSDSKSSSTTGDIYCPQDRRDYRTKNQESGIFAFLLSRL